MPLHKDPNYEYQSGVEPLPLHQQGYLGYGDPLGHMTVKDNASKIETRFWEKERELVKQAVINAFRAVLLSPLKDLKWNAVHYQDIAHIPYSVDDPNEYWNALEQARQHWNAARGRDPIAHQAHFKEMQEFKRYFQAMHPEMDPREANDGADTDLHIMQREIEEKFLADNKDKPWQAIEPRVFKEMKKRIKAILGTGINPASDADDKGQLQYAQESQMALAKTARNLNITEVPYPEESGEMRDLDRVQRLRNMREEWKWRRPFAYCPQHGIYVGQPGMHHGEFTKNMPAGAQGLGAMQYEAPNEFGMKKNFPAGIQWWYGREPQAEEALRERYPDWAQKYDQPDTEWKFGKQAAITDPNDDPSLYGGFIGTHLHAISLLGQYADDLADAALRDMKEEDGKGWHFRKAVLDMDIKGVGPKVASMAWLLLAPMSSQLATIDSHMMDMLGHNYDKEMSNRDYFKFERELQAGRDASGYQHVSLGQFQWGLWDNTRTGPGSHQDHSALRVLNPQDHSTVSWGIPVQKQKGERYEAPEWWQQTVEARGQAARDFDANVAPEYPRSQYPWQKFPVERAARIYSYLYSDNKIMFPLPDWARQRISNWAGAEIGTDIVLLVTSQDLGRLDRVVSNWSFSGAKWDILGMAKYRNTHETSTGNYNDNKSQNGSRLLVASPEAKMAANGLQMVLAEQGVESEMAFWIPLKSSPSRPVGKFPCSLRIF